MLFLRKFYCLPLLASLFFFSCKQKNTALIEDEDAKFAKQDRIRLAVRQEFEMTYDPALGTIPRERLLAAKEYMRRLGMNRRVQELTWQERGPSNISGRTRAVLVDTRDNTGNTIFAASVSGGIWKATNFKNTPVWTPVAENMGSLAVCALAQDPANPNVMYAGTGEGWFNIDAVRGNGIWKSIDGGSTWSQLVSTDSTANSKSHNFDFIQDIVVNSSGVVFATGRPSRFCNTGGVFRSTNGGTSWSRPIGTLATGQDCDSAYNFYGADLEIGANGDVYATTGMFGTTNATRGRIFRSPAADAGITGSWIDITPAGIWQRIEIACAPSAAGTLYALLQGTGEGIGGIKKSVDFGSTWQDLPLPTWCNQGTNSNDFTNGQALYDLIAQVDPANANTVYIGGIDWFKSTNGGTSWTQMTQWAGKCSTLPVVHADQHNLVFMPGSSQQFIVSNDGGVYYTANAGANFATYTAPNVNNNANITYSLKNIGYNVTQFYSCDVHPTLTNYFLGGTQDNGTQRFSTVGLSTTVEASLGGDGGFSHIDQKTGNIQVISSYYNGFYYSRNNGASFINIDFNSNGRFINPSDYDDATSMLYTADDFNTMGLIRNLNGTGNPTYTSVTIPALNGRQISAVKVDPTVSGNGTIWIAGSTQEGSSTAVTPLLVKLTNANTTNPTVLATSAFSGVSLPAGAYISSIDINPVNANHIVVTVSNYGVPHILESTNGGATWGNIQGNLPDIPVRWVMFVPTSAIVTGTAPAGLLIATEVGIWFAGAGSANWVPQNNGMPNVRVDMIRYRSSDLLAVAATHGRGVFTTNLTAVSTGIPSVPNTKDFIQYISANGKQLFIKTGRLNTATMEEKIYDIKGRLIYSAKNSYADRFIDIGTLPAGSYIIKIFGNRKEIFTKQFVK